MVTSLKEAVERLQGEVSRLADRQSFTDRLIESGRPVRGAGPEEQGDPTA